jgi:hypothetical protein
MGSTPGSWPTYFSVRTPTFEPAMDASIIRPYFNRHCRFKLRSGKEVFGVVWEVDTGSTRRLFFASVRDYERFQHDPQQPIAVVPMQPEEIMHVENLAS